jgi:hypothetical protein
MNEWDGYVPACSFLFGEDVTVDEHVLQKNFFTREDRGRCRVTIEPRSADALRRYPAAVSLLIPDWASAVEVRSPKDMTRDNFHLRLLVRPNVQSLLISVHIEPRSWIDAVHLSWLRPLAELTIRAPMTKHPHINAEFYGPNPYDMSVNVLRLYNTSREYTPLSLSLNDYAKQQVRPREPVPSILEQIQMDPVSTSQPNLPTTSRPPLRHGPTTRLRRYFSWSRFDAAFCNFGTLLLQGSIFSLPFASFYPSTARMTTLASLRESAMPCHFPDIYGFMLNAGGVMVDRRRGCKIPANMGQIKWDPVFGWLKEDSYHFEWCPGMRPRRPDFESRVGGYYDSDMSLGDITQEGIEAVEKWAQTVICGDETPSTPTAPAEDVISVFKESDDSERPVVTAPKDGTNDACWVCTEGTVSDEEWSDVADGTGVCHAVDGTPRTHLHQSQPVA